MARIPITKKDGSPTPLFWSDRRNPGSTVKRVFREDEEGNVQRSRSLRYDVERKRLRRV